MVANICHWLSCLLAAMCPRCALPSCRPPASTAHESVIGRVLSRGLPDLRLLPSTGVELRLRLSTLATVPSARQLGQHERSERRLWLDLLRESHQGWMLLYGSIRHPSAHELLGLPPCRVFAAAAAGGE